MNLRFFGRRVTALLAAALLIAVALTSCSSTGGKPRSANDGGMGAGTADTPHKVVAMIGHYGPGVAFADLIRKGAEAAAAKDNIELRFSTDPDAPTQSNMVQSAIDSKVDGIAVTLAKPDAMAPAVKAAIAAGIPVVGFNAGFSDWQDLGIKEFFGQDETIAGREAGKASGRRRRQEDALRHPRTGQRLPGRPDAPASRKASAAVTSRTSTSTATT